MCEIMLPDEFQEMFKASQQHAMLNEIERLQDFLNSPPQHEMRIEIVKRHLGPEITTADALDVIDGFDRNDMTDVIRTWNPDNQDLSTYLLLNYKAYVITQKPGINWSEDEIDIIMEWLVRPANLEIMLNFANLRLNSIEDAEDAISIFLVNLKTNAQRRDKMVGAIRIYHPEKGIFSRFLWNYIRAACWKVIVKSLPRTGGKATQAVTDEGSLSLDAIEKEFVDDNDGPLDAMLQEERRPFLWKCIKKLPSNERSVLSIFYFGGRKISNIMVITCNSMSNVKKILSRGRLKLKAAEMYYFDSSLTVG